MSTTVKDATVTPSHAVTVMRIFRSDHCCPEERSHSDIPKGRHSERENIYR